MSVSMSCGAVSSQNNTYFTSSLAKTDSSPCTAKVTQQRISIRNICHKMLTNTFCRSASASRTCASCGWTLSTSPSPAPTTRGCSRASPPSGRPARRRSSPQPPTASPRPSCAERTRDITVSEAEDLSSMKLANHSVNLGRVDRCVLGSGKEERVKRRDSRNL